MISSESPRRSRFWRCFSSKVRRAVSYTHLIIGKFLYYSTSNILIKRDKFIEIGQSFGLPKFKPAKESKSGAYRNATTAIKDRIQVKDGGGTQVYRVYCRDNKKEDAVHIYRELVKETMNSRTKMCIRDRDKDRRYYYDHVLVPMPNTTLKDFI